MEVTPITSTEPITLHRVYEVLSSNKISHSQKTEFMRQHRTQIEQALDVKISPAEFKWIMKNRPLQKFKFVKNSLTKRGDKIMLAETLGIEPCEVDDYIENVEDALQDIDKLSFLPKDQLDAIQTYVYRHGSKEGVVNFLDYELKTSNDLLKTLYKTLEYHTGGMADYFIRPVHRMSNLTMVKLYNVIDKNIKSAEADGIISKEESNEIAKWALVQIYKIQNNSKFINAIKTYRVLKQ